MSTVTWKDVPTRTDDVGGTDVTVVFLHRLPG